VAQFRAEFGRLGCEVSNGSVAIRNRFRVRIAGAQTFRILASKHQRVHPSETSPFQSMYSPSGLHLAASRAGKQAMRQYHRDFRTVAGSAVHIVGCWEYQEWAFSSRPGNRARDKATVPASRIWRDAARRGQNPSLQPFPKMHIWRLSLIHGESECRIPQESRSLQRLNSISDLKPRFTVPASAADSSR
jgi:hypothetical protein